MGVARVFLGADGAISDYQSKLHLMGSQYPSVKEMLEFVDAAHGRADQAQNATQRQAPGAPLPAKRALGSYSGNQVCASCHAEAYSHWQATAHAHALDTLEADPEGAGAECRSCHVTGLGERGGFTDRESSPQLASVGCETCHGPGRAHSAAPAAGYGRVTVSSCAGCHTREHSPKFDYYTYLGKVTHRENAQGSR